MRVSSGDSLLRGPRFDARSRHGVLRFPLFFPFLSMNSHTFFAGIVTVSIALVVTPAFAQGGDDDASISSSSSTSSVVSSTSISSDDSLRVERCKRFSRDGDYDRCVQLIRRLPATKRDKNEHSSSSAAGDWQWTNIENRIDKKIEGAVKFVSTMAKQFCREQTEDTNGTTRDCMARVRDGLKLRVATMIDTAFRADLPSAR